MGQVVKWLEGAWKISMYFSDERPFLKATNCWSVLLQLQA